MIRNTAEYPFSWSLRRQEMWNRCRREYFLHYYAARGGHDADASPELRQIHEMRSLLSASTYVRRTIAAELRLEFYRAHEEEDPEYTTEDPGLTGRAIRRFRIEFRRMLAGEFRIDHAHPMLEELYRRGNVSPEELRMEIEHRLHGALDALESGVLPMLAATRFLFRRPIDSPLEVYAGDLRCHIAPVLAFEEKGVLNIVEANGADSTALLHKYHAVNQLHLSPDRIHSLELIPEKGELRSAGDTLNISRTLREIRDGAAEMRDAVRPDGTVRLEDFPQNRTRCENCRFRDYCG